MDSQEMKDMFRTTFWRTCAVVAWTSIEGRQRSNNCFSGTIQLIGLKFGVLNLHVNMYTDFSS